LVFYFNSSSFFFILVCTVLFSENSVGYAQVGVTAEIRRVELLPDGRSLLETQGGRRFQVIERSMRNGRWWKDEFKWSPVFQQWLSIRLEDAVTQSVQL
jgi:Lon protease-like protein